MLPPVAISEADKAIAFELIDCGYKQCRHSILCPICGKKYLILLDRFASESNSTAAENLRTVGLEYFADKLQQCHNGGHCEQKLVMI